MSHRSDEGPVGRVRRIAEDIDLATLPPLGQVLVTDGIVTATQLRAALDAQVRGGQRMLLGEVLLQMGFVDRGTLLRAVAKSRGIEFVPEPASVFEEGAIALVPEAIRREHRVCPLFLAANELVVATADPQNFFVEELVARETGFQVRFVASPEEKIDALLSDPARAAAHAARQAEELVADLFDGTSESDLSLQDEAEAAAVDAEDAAPVVKLVNFMICSAAAEGASDIHVEPDDGRMRVRYRIDGVLFHRMSPPHRMHAAIASRIKIMAHLDISERRVPQDGEISVKVNGKPIDLRVSTLPGKFGEKIVMRIVDVSTAKLGLERLGFRPEMLERFRRVIDEPYGIVLVTGPTGSGKSTTLYSALGTFDTVSYNVSTVEDPVEANLAGVHQAQVNPRAGFTFSGALRALLRQDPDIIMVGEIRDSETSQIAVQAALTGHQVFTTVHANNVFDVIGRFANMGVDTYSFVAALNGIMAQRLVRLTCRHCAADYVPDAAELARSRITAKRVPKSGLQRGLGCAHCRGTGYRGRKAVAETLLMTDELRDLLAERASISRIKAAAQEAGFRGLREAALAAVFKGETTLEEINRVTPVV